MQPTMFTVYSWQVAYLPCLQSTVGRYPTYHVYSLQLVGTCSLPTTFTVYSWHVAYHVYSLQLAGSLPCLQSTVGM